MIFADEGLPQCLMVPSKPLKKQSPDFQEPHRWDYLEQTCMINVFARQDLHTKSHPLSTVRYHRNHNCRRIGLHTIVLRRS